MDLQTMLALGISTQRVWIDHPSYNRGTYNDPYRRTTDYVSSSGWASQIASDLPASHLGGAILPHHKKHKTSKTGRRVKESERERRRRERSQRRAIARGEAPGQDRPFHGYDPDFDRRVERREEERHQQMQRRRGLAPVQASPWTQSVRVKRERIAEAVPDYFQKPKKRQRVNPTEIAAVQLEEEKNRSYSS